MYVKKAEVLVIPKSCDLSWFCVLPLVFESAPPVGQNGASEISSGLAGTVSLLRGPVQAACLRQTADSLGW